MDNYKEFVIETLLKFKQKNRRNPLCLLPILDDSQELIGYLRPITFDFQKTMPEIIQKITRWKIENPTVSSSIFNVITLDMTRDWIKQYILQRNDRLIFMIVDLEFEYVGFMGVSSFDFQKKTAELDAACRGIKNVLPGIMTYVFKTLIIFLYNILKVQEILGGTVYDNYKIKNIHQRVGYYILEQIPQRLVEINDNESRWTTDGVTAENVGRYYAKVKINKELYKKWIS